MTTEQLNALLVDQAMGELPAEVSDLLNAYLAASPGAREEARRVHRALGLTREVVGRHPELFRGEPTPRLALLGGWLRRLPARPTLAAAALVAALATVGWTGFVAGTARQADAPTAAAPAAVDPPTTPPTRPAPGPTEEPSLAADAAAGFTPLPWARYDLATAALESDTGLRITVTNPVPDFER